MLFCNRIFFSCLKYLYPGPCLTRIKKTKLFYSFLFSLHSRLDHPLLEQQQTMAASNSNDKKKPTAKPKYHNELLISTEDLVSKKADGTYRFVPRFPNSTTEFFPSENNKAASYYPIFVRDTLNDQLYNITIDGLRGFVAPFGLSVYEEIKDGIPQGKRYSIQCKLIENESTLPAEKAGIEQAQKIVKWFFVDHLEPHLLKVDYGLNNFPDNEMGRKLLRDKICINPLYPRAKRDGTPGIPAFKLACKPMSSKIMERCEQSWNKNTKDRRIDNLCRPVIRNENNEALNTHFFRYPKKDDTPLEECEIINPWTELIGEERKNIIIFPRVKISSMWMVNNSLSCGFETPLVGVVDAKRKTSTMRDVSNIVNPEMRRQKNALLGFNEEEEEEEEAEGEDQVNDGNLPTTNTNPISLSSRTPPTTTPPLLLQPLATTEQGLEDYTGGDDGYPPLDQEDENDDSEKVPEISGIETAVTEKRSFSQTDLEEFPEDLATSTYGLAADDDDEETPQVFSIKSRKLKKSRAFSASIPLDQEC